MKDYKHIRSQLGLYLNQDYDLFSKTVPEAILNAIRESDLLELINELNQLSKESDEKVHEVLDDHEVGIWLDFTPRDLLISMRTFALLYAEEERLRELNKSG